MDARWLRERLMQRGDIARSRGRIDRAAGHFGNSAPFAVQLLGDFQSDAGVPVHCSDKPKTATRDALRFVLHRASRALAWAVLLLETRRNGANREFRFENQFREA